jgi:hypothetical protein
MTALAKVCAALFGTSTLVNGLPCAPTAPASMKVQVGPGEIYSMQSLEATPCGTLPADTSHTILKQGIQLDSYTSATLAAPVSTGQSINYLIEAQYQDSDISLDPTTGIAPVVLQFYNAANPAAPWSGPNNSGSTSNTFRDGVIAYQLKAGSAANTGAQITPTPDAGWTGLWVVSVPFGATTLTSSNIAPYPGAPFLSTPILTQVQQSPSVVGGARNVAMSVTAASASASLAADEIIVKSALGANSYVLSNFAKTINLATTGAGGMDTGTAPVSGYVALYAIYNPTAGTSALLATNATAAKQPEVYGGANMPSGYTASALVSVVPTNASGLFPPLFQFGRSVSTVIGTALNTSTPASIVTALNIASFVPKNAKSVSGNQQTQVSATAIGTSALYPSSFGFGAVFCYLNSQASAGGAINIAFSKLLMQTPQTIYYTANVTTGTVGYQVTISGYDF